MILENADAFPSCGVHSRQLIQCPAGGEGAGDPTGEAEEAPIPPRGKQRAEFECEIHLYFEMSVCDERTDDFHKKCIYYCIHYSRLSH